MIDSQLRVSAHEEQLEAHVENNINMTTELNCFDSLRAPGRCHNLSRKKNCTDKACDIVKCWSHGRDVLKSNVQ